MKVTCPDCGLLRVRSSIKRHRGSRPCRAEQIQNRIKAEYGLVVVTTLAWQKVLQWAGVPFERWPAAAGTRDYRRPHMRRHRIFQEGFLPFPSVDKKLYEGLGDALFVEPWVVMLLCGCGTYAHQEKARHETLIKALQACLERGDEFRKALMTTYALGGDRAINVLLVTEGIWNSQRS